MNTTFTAIIKQSGKWWIGWIEEVPGVNAQGKTKEELLRSLKEILGEALEFNRTEAHEAAESGYSEELVTV
jgi:predicted RNase H-like HicB family nuclease